MGLCVAVYNVKVGSVAIAMEPLNWNYTSPSVGYFWLLP